MDSYKKLADNVGAKTLLIFRSNESITVLFLKTRSQDFKLIAELIFRFKNLIKIIVNCKYGCYMWIVHLLFYLLLFTTSSDSTPDTDDQCASIASNTKRVFRSVLKRKQSKLKTTRVVLFSVSRMIKFTSGSNLQFQRVILVSKRSKLNRRDSSIQRSSTQRGKSVQRKSMQRGKASKRGKSRKLGTSLHVRYVVNMLAKIIDFSN